jgi:hypothetical protein
MGIFDQKKDRFSFIEELADKRRKRKGSKTKKSEPVPEPVDKAPAPGSASLELGALKSAPYSLPNISDKKLLTLH